jgi:hypothetical protein
MPARVTAEYVASIYHTGVGGVSRRLFRSVASARLPATPKQKIAPEEIPPERAEALRALGYLE